MENQISHPKAASEIDPVLLKSVEKSNKDTSSFNNIAQKKKVKHSGDTKSNHPFFSNSAYSH